MNTQDNDVTKEVKWGGLLNEFFWTCAGVNKAILRQCPTDYAKYTGIGGTILFTALMAMLSGGYAMMTVFDNQKVAIGFGIFWGLLIFNLDRFIVNTMYSDGKVTISFREFGAGLPRIIMAVFLGIVISTPLELKIFEDEISVQIEDDKKARLAEYIAADNNKLDSLEVLLSDLKDKPLEQTMDPLTGNQQIDNLIKQKNQKTNEYKNIEADIKDLNDQLHSLKNQRDTTQQHAAKIRDQQSKINKKQREVRTVNGEISSLQAQINTVSGNLSTSYSSAREKRNQEEARLQTKIDTLQSKIDNAKEIYKESLDKNYGGFQAHMNAFSKMKAENTTTRISSLFIMILFIIVETAPTFFKMMIASGPYDDLLRSEMHRARVLSDKRISDLNDDINTKVKISTEKNKNLLEAEAQANKLILEQIATAQAEILSTAIAKWREEELKKVEENPSAYIQSSTNNNG